MVAALGPVPPGQIQELPMCGALRGHPGRQSARASRRATRAACRARRSGSGVRRLPVAARTSPTAVGRSTRQPGCTTSGRAPARVRTQHATTSLPIRSALTAPRLSDGHEPWATRGRCLPPTVGRSRTAPRWTAKPARAGWSRPVAAHLQLDAARGQRLLPGDHVVIHRVDEGVVQVEQQRGPRDLDIEAVLHGRGFPFPPAASSRPRFGAASDSGSSSGDNSSGLPLRGPYSPDL